MQAELESLASTAGNNVSRFWVREYRLPETDFLRARLSVLQPPVMLVIREKLAWPVQLRLPRGIHYTASAFLPFALLMFLLDGLENGLQEAAVFA